MRLQLTKTTRNSIRALMLASTIALGAGLTTVQPVYAYAPPAGFADLVAQVSPAVVFIEVTVDRPAPSEQMGQPPFPFPGNPFENAPKRFGQPQQPPQQGHALGSGFIITAKGEVVTNNHVVEGAQSISVKLQDGRKFKARVVGRDKLTDVALLQLEDASDLPTVPFGDSSKLRVGDAVIAVGNPYGLGGTVTAGIVSALGRNINAGPYDSFIQTDAAINKGNSGGPLFDTAGDVVGMNSMIFSPTGGSVGIGFSIPSKTVQSIITQLRENGHVSRGWLGVQIQKITPALADALGLEAPEGALVAAVQPDSPALAAGFKSGDVILSVDGKKIKKMHELPALVAALPAGKTVTMKVLRQGKPLELRVKIGALDAGKMMARAGANQPQNSSADQLGVTVKPLTPDMMRQLGLSEGETGVVITQVDPDSPNADKLRPGDVIQQAGDKPVTSPADLGAAIKAAGSKDTVLLKIQRRGTALYVGAKIKRGG